MIILPSTYFGTIEQYAAMLRGDCTIDIHENYIKRSPRNRANIAAANGILPLTVLVRNGNRPRTPICDVEIDYSKRWQHQHWVSIVSAYKSSPYFDHYEHLFAPLFERQYKFLVDLNTDTLGITLPILGIPTPSFSEQYIDAQPDHTDMRPKQRVSTLYRQWPYVQVFSDRRPFEPNLSIIDLLFCEGPDSAAVLAHSICL